MIRFLTDDQQASRRASLMHLCVFIEVLVNQEKCRKGSVRLLGRMGKREGGREGGREGLNF